MTNGLPPKVFILIDTIAVGGPGKGILQYGQLANRAVADYNICTFAYPGIDNRPFIEEARERGLPLTVVESNGKFDVMALRKCVSEARAYGATVVESHGYKTHLAALWISRALHIPWIAVEHGWTYENFKIKMYNALSRRLVRRAQLGVTVSPPLQDEISRFRGNRPTLMIMNAINVAEFGDRSSTARDEIRQRYNIAPDEQVLGVFGRLSPEKGHAVLLEAFSHIAKKFPKTKLLFVGDGCSRETLKTLAGTYGISHRVIFAGFHRKVLNFYEATDIVVIPSLSEGLPNVLLEALALGKAVVSTKVGAVPEVLVHGENGWLATPNSAVDLQQVLVHVLSNQEEFDRVVLRSSASIFPRFSAEQRVKKLEHLYQSIHAFYSGQFRKKRTQSISLDHRILAL